MHVVDADGRSPDAAVRTAQRSFGQLVGRQPARVSWARVTVSDHGVGDPSDRHSTDLTLTIDHRLVWLVVFAGFRQYAYGPRSADGPTRAQFWDVSLAVLIDPDTHEFLRAETVG